MKEIQDHYLLLIKGKGSFQRLFICLVRQDDRVRDRVKLEAPN
jgi:hypothetical protein